VNTENQDYLEKFNLKMYIHFFSNRDHFSLKNLAVHFWGNWLLNHNFVRVCIRTTTSFYRDLREWPVSVILTMCETRHVISVDNTSHVARMKTIRRRGWSLAVIPHLATVFNDFTTALWHCRDTREHARGSHHRCWLEAIIEEFCAPVGCFLAWYGRKSNAKIKKQHALKN